MVRPTLLVAAAALLVTGCSQQLSRQERAVQEQILRDRVTAWARVRNNRDRDSLATFYVQTPGLIMAWPDGRRTTGWEETSAALRQYFGQIARVNVVVQDPTVELLSADAGVVIFRHSTDMILQSTDRDIYTGNGTQIWTKDETDGLWKIRTEQISRSPGG